MTIKAIHHTNLNRKGAITLDIEASGRYAVRLVAGRVGPKVTKREFDNLVLATRYYSGLVAEHRVLEARPLAGGILGQ